MTLTFSDFNQALLKSKIKYKFRSDHYDPLLDLLFPSVLTTKDLNSTILSF